MKIKVMADYGCHRLWFDAPADEMGQINPADLGLSKDLQQALCEWAERFEAILDQEDPASSAFPSSRAEQTFDEDGRALASRIAHDLGPAFRVRYWRNPEVAANEP